MVVANQILVGMADLKVADCSATFTCLGLGSCIGLVAIDFEANIGGMVHIMLPEAFKDKPIDRIGKFVNTGVPELIRQLEAKGAMKRRIVMAYGGGAQVFKYGNGTTLDVGARNSVAVETHLRKIQARVIASEVGGNCGRTIIVDCRTGEVRVRTVIGGERILCNLKQPSQAVAA